MRFQTEPEPVRGVAEEVAPGIRRIVADNPGPMTYHGTNTYLIDAADGITVLDPGPDSQAHVAAVLAAGGGRIARILLTHTHRDHLGAVAAVKAATGAPSIGYQRSADPGFTPDIALGDGDAVAGLTAIHTPGHAADHLCFALPGGMLFTGDHVMPWSTSVVNPPNGDMAAYFASLQILLNRDDRLYLSGHGPAIADPHPYVRELLEHRIARENAIAAALADGAASTERLTERIYRDVDPRLRRAAERNVLAHLLKLEGEGRARREGDAWRLA
jgi:glyoxylase-like metal-dependent hydrolase (beta-lactamase superfamily II)